MAQINAFTKEFLKVLKSVDRWYYHAFYRQCCEDISVDNALKDMEFHLVETVYYKDKPCKGELSKPEKVRVIAEFIKKYGNNEIVELFKTDIKNMAYPNEECHKYTQVALDIIGKF